jgi:hypothetical protein
VNSEKGPCYLALGRPILSRISAFLRRHGCEIEDNAMTSKNRKYRRIERDSGYLTSSKFDADGKEETA